MKNLTKKLAMMVLVALTLLTVGVEANAAELPTSATVVEPSDYVCVMTKEEAEERVAVETTVEVEDTTEVVVESECTYMQFIFNRLEKMFHGEIGFGEFINDVRTW